MKAITILKIIKSERYPNFTMKKLKAHRRIVEINLKPLMGDYPNWHLSWESYLRELIRFEVVKGGNYVMY